MKVGEPARLKLWTAKNLGEYIKSAGGTKFYTNIKKSGIRKVYHRLENPHTFIYIHKIRAFPMIHLSAKSVSDDTLFADNSETEFQE